MSDFSVCYTIESIRYVDDTNKNTPRSAFVYVHQDDDVEETITNILEKMGGGKVEYFRYHSLSSQKFCFPESNVRGGF